MKQDFYFYATVIVIALIVVAGAFVYPNLNFSGYKYSAEKNGVLFVSNEKPIPDHFSEMREKKVFVVAPQFVENGNENTFMASSVTLFSTVLVHKEKDLILVARVLDANGSLAKCQSNKGDVKTNEDLPLDECNALLNDSSNARIFVSFPKEGQSRATVVFENGSATITPPSFQTINSVSFIFLENLYPDARQIIERINGIVDQVDL